MKKLVLVAAALATAASGFAQDVLPAGTAPVSNDRLLTSRSELFQRINSGVANKTAATLGDTILSAVSDSMYNGLMYRYYLGSTPNDSGFVYGANANGTKGVARLGYIREDVSGNDDTTVNFLGWWSRWGGRIQTNSTKQVTFNFWKRGADTTAITGRAKNFLIGKPGMLMASRTIADTALRTNGNATIVYLPTASVVQGVNYDGYTGVTFGFTFSKTDVDTFGLLIPNNIATNFYTVKTSTGDTLRSANVYTQNASGAWVSTRYEQGLPGYDPVIAPIVQFRYSTASVKGYSSNNLTVFGNFPNPATNLTTFKFSLNAASTVTGAIYDQTGRLVSMQRLGQMASGEHQTSVDVSTMATGSYVYVLETGNGAALATAFEVVH